MDRRLWLELNQRGTTLFYPRKPSTKTVDTLLFNCTMNSLEDLEKYLKLLNTPGRILIVAPVESDKNFPEEAGKVWNETALREVIKQICKFKQIKLKLFRINPPEINDGYKFAYIGLIKE